MKRGIPVASLLLLIGLVALGLGIERSLARRALIVYVQGEVRSPGKVALEEGMTVSLALESDGQPDPIAGPDQHPARPSLSPRHLL